MKFDAPPPCTDDPGRWFSKDEARREDAKRVCATCPFQDPCRELSERPIVFKDSVYVVRNGVWAGQDRREAPDTDRLSPKQRQTRDRAAEIRGYLAEGRSKYWIGKKMGLGSGSINNIVNNHLSGGTA